MTKFINLVKAIYASGINNSSQRKKNGKFKKRSIITQIIISIILCVIFGFSFLYSSKFAYIYNSQTILVEKYFILMLASAFFYSFFMTFSIIKTFYFTKDNSFIFLPIRPIELFLAKSFIAFFSYFLYGGNVVLTYLICTCIVYKLPFYSYLISIFIFLLVNIITVLLTFCIFILLQSLFKLDKHPTLSNILPIVLSFIAAFTLLSGYFASSSISSNLIEENNLNNFISCITPFINCTCFYSWAGYLLFKSLVINSSLDYLNLVYLIIIAAVTVVFSFFFIEYFYFKNIKSENKATQKRKLSNSDFLLTFSKAYRRNSSQFKSFFFKEFYNYKQNPLILFFTIFQALVFVVIFFVNNLLFIKDFANSNFPVSIILAIMLTFELCMPLISYPSISLEGSSFYILKTFPIKIKSFVKGKILANYLISFILTSIIIVTFVAIFNTYFTILDLIFLVLFAFIYTFAMICSSFYQGAVFANFNFTSATEITSKGIGAFLCNFSGFIFPIFSIPVLLVFGFIFPKYVYLSFIISSIVYLCVAYIFYYLSYQKCFKIFKDK